MYNPLDSIGGAIAAGIVLAFILNLIVMLFA